MTPLDPTKFATAKLNLVLGVGLDTELPKLALRIVSLFVGRHMHAERGGEAWPAIKTICEELGVSSGSMVRDALYALLERGHLVADRFAGQTTRYKIADRYFDGAPQPVQEATPARGEPGGEPAMSATPQPAMSATPQPAMSATPQPAMSATPQPARQATSTGNRIPGNEYRELNSGKGDSPPSPSHDLIPAKAANKDHAPRRQESSVDGFEGFWRTYPRNVGKLAAAKAFERAVRGGAAPSDITAGAARFAAERLLEPDPERREKFTPHPATWLNAGRWNDAPAPAPSLFGGQQQRRRPSMFDLALRGRVTP